MDAALLARPPGIVRARAHPGRLIASLVVVLAAVAGMTGSGAHAADPPPSDEVATKGSLQARGWIWPLPAVRIDRPFLAPPHPYGPGHRGIDLVSAVGSPVRAPAGGTIAFVGAIAGRGILTIDHGDGLVTTLEPVDSALPTGAAVTRGDVVATTALGGHASSSLHFGVRLHGEYINPLLLLGGVPRAVLLPCC